MSSDQKQFFTVDEAAEYLCVGRTLVTVRIRAGDMPSLKVGGRRLVPRAALDEWVAAQVEKQRSR